MLFPTSLSAATVNLATAFLILSWKEMFDAYTPDTFQPRLYNLPLLVEELREVTERALSDNRWESHVKLVQSEIAAELSKDSSILAKLPYFEFTCRQLSSLQNLQEIERLARLAAEQHRAYEEGVIQAFLDVAPKAGQEKESAMEAVQRLATIALNRGFSAEDFESVCDEQSYTLQPQDWAEKFLALIESAKQPDQTFDCIVPVFGLTTRLVRQLLKWKAEFKVQSASEAPWKNHDFPEKPVFFRVDVNARTSAEAARQALRKIRPTIDLFGFYDRGQVATIGDKVWVAQGGKARVINSSGSISPNFRPRTHLLKLTKRALEIPEALLSGRVVNALEHYGLAQTNSAFRVRLVNLWSAVECLAIPSNSGDSVIGRVQDTVIPIVVWRRVDKLTRYIASALTHMRETQGLADCGPLFSPFGVVTAEEVLRALTRPLKHEEIKPWYAAVSTQPLLLFRIFALRKRFSDPKNVLSDWKSSEERKRWHLARIYRARNLIVHHGHEAVGVRHLVEHLQYYLSVTLSRILHGMSTHIGWSAEDSVVHWRTRIAYARKMLEDAPEKLLVRDFFPLPVRIVHDVLWEARPSPAKQLHCSTTSAVDAAPPELLEPQVSPSGPPPPLTTGVGGAVGRMPNSSV